MRVFDPDGDHARLLGRVIVAAGKHGVPDKNHLWYGNAKGVLEFSDPVSLVDAMLSHIDGGRTPQSD